MSALQEEEMMEKNEDKKKKPKPRNVLNVSSLMRCWQARANNVAKNKRLSANAVKAISLETSFLEITMIVVQP